MVILHVSPIVMTAANGPRFSVPGLTGALNRIEGVSAAILNTAPEEKLDASEIESYDFPFFSRYGRISNLPEPFNRPDLVVFHGIYKPRYLPLWWEIRSIGIPYVITPRVSLTRKAQDQRRWKKSLANLLVMNNFIHRAVAIHYLTRHEKEESLQFDCNNFVVGNGISIHESQELAGRNGKRMIYIGRYDIHHKGLDVLMLAIGHIKGEMLERGLSVDFYGSWDNERKLLQQQCEVNGLEEVLTIHGPVFGKMKEDVLVQADLFIATSRFEGHPMAVLEAMAYSLPVIATPGTSIAEEIEDSGSGWAVELDFRDIGEAILEALSDKEELARRGAKAKKLIKEQYTWERIASDTLAQYEDLVKGSRIGDSR
jgi:glycosyltransferase involved in cell wall biosynthesis